MSRERSELASLNGYKARMKGKLEMKDRINRTIIDDVLLTTTEIEVAILEWLQRQTDKFSTNMTEIEFKIDDAAGVIGARVSNKHQAP